MAPKIPNAAQILSIEPVIFMRSLIIFECFFVKSLSPTLILAASLKTWPTYYQGGSDDAAEGDEYNVDNNSKAASLCQRMVIIIVI